MKSKIEKKINDKRIKSIKKILKNVLKYEEDFHKLSDKELQKLTFEFRKRFHYGETLDELLPESYALVREGSRRVLGMFPKEVQVMGAIVLHQGNIAEMQTGEGKTLTATMPLYLNALSGKGAYLITTNDYLAKRDLEEMKPLYEWLGLTASLGFVDDPDYKYEKDEKKKLYDADIIYSTNGRIGFDYLIDNLADQLEDKFQKELNYCIIDEVDSVILDAAQTPLVISGAPRVQSNLFNVVKEFVDTLKVNKHFYFKKYENEIYLLDSGVEAAHKYFNIENLYDVQHITLIRNINLALRAKYLFDRNIDYYIIDGKVILIDRISGRLLPGTKLQSGLHQSIEAKEKLDISEDMSTLATITFQNLFRQFNKFAGMSATSKLGEKEFFDLYSKIVVQIPTDKPVKRIDKADKVFLDRETKQKDILNTVKQLHLTRRPVLVITRTAEDAEYFSEKLFEEDIPNNLLIAQNVAKEAQMIAEAGYLSNVTVATSMAGRGTDIKLEEGVKELGGLAVIISEHMENSRIDRQLRGRAGRQGDPGSSQIYISLEDHLVKKWGNGKWTDSDEISMLKERRVEDSRLMKNRVARIVEQAQVVSEEHGLMTRQMNNEFARSISKQRQLIYTERNKILEIDKLESFNFKQLAYDVFTRLVYVRNFQTEREVKQYIYKNISFQFSETIPLKIIKDKDLLIEFLYEQFKISMQTHEEKFSNNLTYKKFLQKALLKAIDTNWVQQVDFLQQLKLSINNRQMGRRNAIFEYHRTALESFHSMGMEIKESMIRNLCLSMISYDKKGDLLIHFP